jgi:hypothetical protein
MGDIVKRSGEGPSRCDDCCDYPLGPHLLDRLWATIATPDTLLCLSCTEQRLGRRLVQGDLVECNYNAGWIPFDASKPTARLFARGRQLLPRA